ncbi:MAG: alpha/beta fold hydrolase, partial [Sinobacteraceae bacterium]|nr:alpha/beta fold hydrolase [Nevskiaceae bacterium]
AWLQLTQAAAARFAARSAQRTPPLQAEDARALYDLWIDCAEAAYSEVAHTASYCQLQAELINTNAELLLEQRRAPGEGTGWMLPRPPAPWQAAGAAFAAGALRQAVWQHGRSVLYRYLPLPFIARARAAPVLLCYSLVNRPEILDLQPDRSLIRGLLSRGLEVYLLDWGYPDAGDSQLSLHDYINVHLHGCVQHVCAAEALPAVNLLGICQGGTFALCYAALHPAQVANLICMGSPVDFQTPTDLLSKWARPLDVQLLAQLGNFSGQLLTSLFLALSPFRLIQQKYVNALERSADPAAREFFMRMEAWIFDCPDLAATAAAQFVRWCYQENRLLQGSLRLGTEAVDLRRIRQPVLNVYALRDHIVPPAASTALGSLIASHDYTDSPLDTGHIGLYVSERARQLPQLISSWLASHS